MAKRKWTDEELKLAVRKSKSISEVLKLLDTTSRSTVEKYIKKLKLSTAHFTWGRPRGIKIDGCPNAYWRRFKQRLDNYDSADPETWTNEHILGHILKRYRDFYGVDFTLSYSGAPSKCTEMYCVKRMMVALGDEDGFLAKQYIDWVFDKAIQPKDTNIRSIGFFFTGSLIYRFKTAYRKLTKITRSTQLPPQYESLAVGLELTVSTYGDLAFAKMAMENDPENDEYTPYFNLFTKLKEAGFDTGLLDNLEN
jgi:hypothetical protein